MPTKPRTKVASGTYARSVAPITFRAQLVDTTAAIDREAPWQAPGMLTVVDGWVVFDVWRSKSRFGGLLNSKPEPCRVFNVPAVDVSEVEVGQWSAEGWRTAHNWTWGTTGSKRVTGEAAIVLRSPSWYAVFRTQTNPVVLREQLRSVGLPV